MAAFSTPPGPTARPAILVVDDDPMLLTLLRTVLERRGFIVYAAASGEQAIELSRQHGAMALALLDVCMPGLDGPRTLTELRRIDPGLRACFMSGHTGAYGPEDLRARGMVRFFDKPFAIHELADELWRLAQEEARQLV